MEKNPAVWRKFEELCNLKGWFLVKESRRYDVSVLINHHQGFKNTDTMCWLINDGCLMKNMFI